MALVVFMTTSSPSHTITERSDKSTRMRVVTGARSTTSAGIQPSEPFGRTGTCTRSHCAPSAPVASSSTAKWRGPPNSVGTARVHVGAAEASGSDHTDTEPCVV